MRFLHEIAERVEISVLTGVIIIAGCLYGFIEMAEIAGDATPHSFDTAILLALREPGNTAIPIGPAWLNEAVRDITALGSASILVFVSLAVIGYLVITSRSSAAVFVFLSVGSGQILSSLLKLGIDRPRPALVPHLAEVFTMSFPSGHAMLSAVTYLTLGSLAAHIQPSRASRIYVISVAATATFLVGASRLYLGVHWPSDVFAGWCAGASWAILCWLTAQFILRRRGDAALIAAKST